MRARLCALVFGCLTLFAAGCAGVGNRRAILETLACEPMTPREWSRVAGVYVGTIRSTTKRGGAEGVRVDETRIEISGSPWAPMIFLKMDTSFTSSWTYYSEKAESFTNIPARRYGTQGYVFASTHAPNQLLLRLRADGLSPNVGPFMIITFHDRNCADVDFVGHSGWRGEGSLRRARAFPYACP